MPSVLGSHSSLLLVRTMRTRELQVAVCNLVGMKSHWTIRTEHRSMEGWAQEWCAQASQLPVFGLGLLSQVPIQFLQDS
jgi:hypothetical protein